MVAEKFLAYALSFAAGHAVQTNSARTFADGVACRVPSPDALDIIMKGAALIVRVGEDDIAAQAIRIYYRTTHNLAEGAGAAPLAALLQEKSALCRQARRPHPLRRQNRHAGDGADFARRDACGLRGTALINPGLRSASL